MSTYDFSTLYTTLPYHPIKDKLIDLINRTFIRENTQYLACNEECAFFTSDVYNNHNLWSCQKVCDALVYLLDNIFLLDLELNFIDKLLVFRWELIVLLLLQICFFFVVGGISMRSLSREGQADIVEAFNSASGCLGDLLDIDNVYFDQMVDRICPAELQLSGAGSSDAGAPFLDLNLCISNGTVSAGVYDKRDDFGFGVVGFPFLGGGVPRRASCGMCVSRLIGFARAFSGLGGFNYRNRALAAKLLGRGCRCFRLRGSFSRF